MFKRAPQMIVRTNFLLYNNQCNFRRLINMSGLEKSDELQVAIEDGPSRYAAFAMRLRTLITASSRCE